MKHVTGILILVLGLLLPITSDVFVFAQRGVGVKARGQATPYLSGTFRALVIGNDKYKDPEGLWKPLKTAVNDARAVADVLKNQYGFGDVRLLLNATRRQMGRAINRITEDSRKNDSVMIYYAGHGYLRESTKEGYWIPVDAEGRDDTTYYRNSTIKTKLAVLSERAMHVLLVSDSCFSGALLREGNRGINIDERNERYFRKVAAKRSVQILAAGGLEFVDDNYKGTGHSPFTYFFLQELKTNTGGILDATQLSSAVVRNVANNVQQSPEKGVLHGAGHEGGEFFFAKVRALPPPPVAKPQARTLPKPPQSINAEEEFWREIKKSKDKTDFDAYLATYPKGRFAALARLKVRKLARTQPKAKGSNVAAITTPKGVSAKKTPSGLPKIALFPIEDYTSGFNDHLLLKLAKFFSSARKKFRLTHSYYKMSLSDVVIFSKEMLFVKDSWSGFWTKKPNRETVFKAGQLLGVDFLLMYKIQRGACGASNIGSTFIVYLLNVKTKEIHDHEGKWTCESPGLETVVAIKKLLDEHVTK